MYRLRLELAGYEVLVAADGEEGLRVARESRPDLIFVDIRLPKMDGMAVLEALRADATTAGLPVVVLSNFSGSDTVERALALGAREYLIKSRTNPVQLADEVPSWLTPQPASG